MIALPNTRRTINPQTGAGLAVPPGLPTLLTDWQFTQTILHPVTRKPIVEPGQVMTANTYYTLAHYGIDSVEIEAIDWPAEDLQLQIFLNGGHEPLFERSV